MFEVREGEERLARDPATMKGDAEIVFIGTVRSAWKKREECPKNMGEARERGQTATIELSEPYRRGLSGLESATHIVLLTWFQHAPRDLIVQKPRHADFPRGTFALRSPARPNPIGMHVAKILRIDPSAGIVTIDAIDALDGTPVVDIKPYFASTDSIPEAKTGG